MNTANTVTTADLILVVEDEPKLASVIVDYLAADSFQTHHIDDGADVADWVVENKPALVLLDIMLPNKDGITICKEIRQFSNVPILMVTAKVDEIDRLLGLEIGADDYICKPFSPREVVARVKANLRRWQPHAPAIPDNRLLLIDNKKMQVRLNGSQVELTAVEFRLLEKMADHPGQIFSRSQLIDAGYHDNRVVSERTIDSHIKKLRKQLHAADPASPIVQSVYGVGYKVELDPENWP